MVDRVKVNKKVFKYAKALEDGDVFPPIKIALRQDGKFHLKDGRHRISASLLCGRETIRAKYSTKPMERL